MGELIPGDEPAWDPFISSRVVAGGAPAGGQDLTPYEVVVAALAEADRVDLVAYVTEIENHEVVATVGGLAPVTRKVMLRALALGKARYDEISGGSGLIGEDPIHLDTFHVKPD